MKELAREYRKSLKMITRRVNDLKPILKQLEQNPKKNIDQIEELRLRFKPLLSMQRDLQEVSREVEHYYDRSWWRSEKYTHNRKKSRQTVSYFTNLFEDELLDKLEPDREVEEDIV